MKLLDALALHKGLSSVTGVNVVVIGEAVDCYLSGVADRCPDGAVPVVTVTARNEALGGAANTAVKGGDYTKKTLPEASLVEQLGSVVQILPFVEDRSTTSIIERIRTQLE